MFQRYSLFPHLSVRDNIAFPLAIRKLASAERERRVDAMLKLVQLGEFAHRRPSQLSEASSSAWRLPGHWSTNHASC